MTYGIDRFRQLIQSVGLQQGNRYEVMINDAAFTEDTLALCCDVTLGTMAPETTSYQSVNPLLKPIVNILYTPLTTEWYCLENGEPYDIFTAWQGLFKTDDFHLRDFNTYAQGKNVIVREYNRQGRAIALHAYYNCYPIEVSGKTLSFENTSAALKFSVTFNYETMTTGKLSQ